jgi:hypothetical protein
MPKSFLKWGDWNAICDVCGFKFKASELKKDWQGLMVCPTDYELRHPQDFLRVRPDNPSVPWSRPEGEDVFINVCWLWDRSAYANLGTADCMQANFTPMTFSSLWELKYGTPYPTTSYTSQRSGIPGYAIPGYAIPAVTYTGYPF